MKIIKAGYQILTPQSPTKHIERVARTCYKSEDKICEGSDIKMIKGLLERRHLAMIEHASVCIEVDQVMFNLLREATDTKEIFVDEDIRPQKSFLRFTSYIRACDNGRFTKRYLISGNLRAWYEFMEYYTDALWSTALPFIEVIVEAAGGKNGVLGKWHKSNLPDDNDACKFPDSFAKLITDFSKLTDEERWVHEDISVQFTVDRGITLEIVRMRDCSFAQESTRYCNYSNGKFNHDITVIEPCFWNKDSNEYHVWKNACKRAERAYFEIIDEGARAEQARDILPHSVKAELIATTNLREWHHILALRACDATGPAHPQIKEVMVPLLNELKADPKYTNIFKDLQPK